MVHRRHLERDRHFAVPINLDIIVHLMLTTTSIHFDTMLLRHLTKPILRVSPLIFNRLIQVLVQVFPEVFLQPIIVDLLPILPIMYKVLHQLFPRPFRLFLRHFRHFFLSIQHNSVRTPPDTIHQRVLPIVQIVPLPAPLGLFLPLARNTVLLAVTVLLARSTIVHKVHHHPGPGVRLFRDHARSAILLVLRQTRSGAGDGRDHQPAEKNVHLSTVAGIQESLPAKFKFVV